MARSRNNSSLDGSVVEVPSSNKSTFERYTGILSQTLCPSPTIRWILPAKVRRKSKNDVVFVGETFVQLREFLDTGFLADITAKFDLGAQILAAKVISAPTQIATFIDQVIGQERDELRYMIKGKPIGDTQPPQILVASLVTGDLVFLYAKQYTPSDVRFVYGKRTLLGGIPLPERYGKHIAVDPESRALALASSRGHCAIFKLKQVDFLQEEIDKWDPTSSSTFEPAHEEHFIRIDGYIVKMDFLPSTSKDPHKVILLLLVSNEQRGARISLRLFTWDSHHALSDMKPLKCSGQTLPIEDGFPLMLMPSSKYASFTVVTDRKLALFDNIFSAEAKCITFNLPQQSPANWKYSDPPLWVQWAKPQRLSPLHQDHDDFFLVREDGELRYYVVTEKSSLKVEAHHSPGRLPANVDSAFTMLAGPPGQGGDIFIVGGDMTDAGVYHLTARRTPELTQVIPNMCPTQDMITINPFGREDSKNSHRSTRVERTFTCSGRGDGHGYVNELRFGIAAQLSNTIDYPDSASTTHFWVLEDSRNERVLLIASHPLHTTVITFHLPSLEAEETDAASCPGLDFDSATLAIASVASGVFAQITQQSINLASFSSGFTPTTLSQATSTILAAGFDIKNGLLAIAIQSSGRFALKIGKLELGGDQSYTFAFASASHYLDEEPIALCLCSFATASMLVVSTNAAMLHVFLADAVRGLKLISSQKFVDLIPGVKDVSASSLQMLSERNSRCGILLCGFRNGKLGCLTVRLEKGPPPTLHIRSDDSFDLGSATVYVTDDSCNGSEPAALAYCGSELRRIVLVTDGSGLDYQLTSIWLTDTSDPSRMQPTVYAVCRIPTLEATDDGSSSGLLMWAAEDEILISSLVLQPQAVPRRLKVHGTPQKLAYSRRLDKIVVAGTMIEAGPPRSDKASGKTPDRIFTTKPALQLISPSSPTLEKDDRTITVFGDDDDRVTCLLHWTPSDGAKHYDMALVGLDTDAADTDPRSGRVMCISAKYIGSGPGASAKVRTVARYPGKPVYDLCAFGLCSLLTAAGNEIVLQAIDVGSRKWSILSRFTLPSTALSLSTQGSFIFAGTAYHSMVTLRERDGEMTFHTSDYRTRNATSVLASPGLGTIITAASDGGTHLLGFAEQLKPTRPKLLFEATMPLGIERIRESHVMTNQHFRQDFLGCTLDGTIYRFMILQSREWALLNFLENLSPLMSNKSTRSDTSWTSSDAETSDEDWEAVSPGSPTSSQSSSRFDPFQMHIHGDALASMLQPGPYNLRSLLVPEIKTEDGLEEDTRKKAPYLEFVRLATPVLGEEEDPIGAMARWLRKLLRLPQ